MRKLFLLFLILLPVFVMGNDDIWDNDFYLKNFFTNGHSANTAEKMFNQLALEYGIAISPTFTEPAETLGSKGFEISTVYSFHSVGGTDVKDESGNSYSPWEGTYKGANPSSLHTVTLKARKGLPASLELGGNFTYIFGTHSFVMGGQLKASLIEGINMLPDVAIRVAFNKLFGAKQVNLNSLTFDFMIGYDFSIAGMIALAPYFAWSFTKINASSDVFVTDTSSNPFGCDEHNENCDYSDDSTYNNVTYSFPSYKPSLHRFVLGVRLHNAAFIFTPEVMFSTESVWGFNVKIGVDF